MSRRRKNAGEGYGYMFHGAFAKKADAVAKERKTKGAWVKGTPTNNGYRYIVMSPRTNPIKRKKKAPKVTPATNPTELLVMGANPTKHVKLPPGDEYVVENESSGTVHITIRTNPERRTNSLGSFLGFSPSKPSKKELAESRRGFRSRVRQRTTENRDELKRLRKSARGSQKQSRTSRVFHEVFGKQKFDAEGFPINPSPVCGAMIGGYPCSRKPGHKGPHLPQGATMRTRKRLPHNWQPRAKNPSAEALREKFTGMEVERVRVMEEPHMPAGNYAMLGKLLGLYVKPRTGGQVLQITAAGGTLVVSDETARQIYFVGGDQDISSGLATFGALDRGAGLFELGEARRIDYKQRKEHVPHPEADSWRHEFGEETGVRPIALYDSTAKRILLEGGEYVIRAEGIVN